MKCFAIAAFPAVTEALSSDEVKFLSYMAEYGKRYSTIEEFRERMEIFFEKDL